MKCYVKLTPNSIRGTQQAYWIEVDSIQVMEDHLVAIDRRETHLTLVSGEYLGVKETPEKILKLIEESGTQSVRSDQFASLDVDLLRNIRSLIDTLAVRLGDLGFHWPSNVRTDYEMCIKALILAIGDES